MFQGADAALPRPPLPGYGPNKARNFTTGSTCMMGEVPQSTLRSDTGERGCKPRKISELEYCVAEAEKIVPLMIHI